MKLRTLGGRLASLLTPEAARDWELLRAFRDQADPARQSAARARELLLDSFAADLKRD